MPCRHIRYSHKLTRNGQAAEALGGSSRRVPTLGATWREKRWCPGRQGVRREADSRGTPRASAKGRAGAVGRGTEGIIVTIRGDESNRARKRDHTQEVRTFLNSNFPGATCREFSAGGSHVFRVQAAMLPDPELVLSDDVLEHADPVPYLDQETADALKRGARVILTHGRRRITERPPSERRS
jgi:hypothetical protein